MYKNWTVPVMHNDAHVPLIIKVWKKKCCKVQRSSKTPMKKFLMPVVEMLMFFTWNNERKYQICSSHRVYLHIDTRHSSIETEGYPSNEMLVLTGCGAHAPITNSYTIYTTIDDPKMQHLYTTIALVITIQVSSLYSLEQIKCLLISFTIANSLIYWDYKSQLAYFLHFKSNCLPYMSYYSNNWIQT